MNIIIDIDNIRNNIRLIRKKTKRDIICVVKSNAYGLGARRIVKALLKENVNYFFFNKLHEYLDVKDLLKNKNVIIFEPLSISDILKHYEQNLILTINSLGDLQRYKSTNRKIRAHIQIDTGMNRFGVRSINECKKIIENINDFILLDGIYTHFASNKDEYEYYNTQLDKFKKYLNLYNFNVVHACASSSLHKELIGNMVRVGIAMYGYASKLNLNKTCFAYTNVLNILNLEKNTFVGYESKYKTASLEQICVLNTGYYDSTLIDKVYFNNREYKFIGKTCMNHAYICTNNEINLQSRLSLFKKFGIIEEEYDYYKLLTSFNHLPKTYLERNITYEIPYIFKQTSKKSIRCEPRKRSS